MKFCVSQLQGAVSKPLRARIKSIAPQGAHCLSPFFRHLDVAPATDGSTGHHTSQIPHY